MRLSPARRMAPEPSSWIPIESLESLPELEELLDPRYLVESGQSRAVKIGSDSKGYVLVDSDIASTLEFEKEEKKHLSHRRWQSKRRTLRMRRQNTIIKFCVIITIVVMLLGGILKIASHIFAAKPTKPVLTGVIPTGVAVNIEGRSKVVYSVDTNLEDFLMQNHWSGLLSSVKSFNHIKYSKAPSSQEILIRYPKALFINVDGSSKALITSQLTVRDLLSEQGIVVDGQDIVTPSLENPLKGVSNISIVRLSTSTRIVTKSIPFEVEKQNDPTLLKGKSTVKREGSNGSIDITMTQTRHDGVVANEVESSKVITKSPVNQIILIGTKVPQHQSGKATFYSAASGTCAHRTLPLGTVVTVTNTSTGASVTCKVADRGPFGEGRIVDLSKDGFSSIASISQGVVSVSLSW